VNAADEPKDAGASRPHRPRRVVISSLTGKPIPWGEEDEEREAEAERKRPSGHDAELLRDVPPHWGNGH
jgi:hypothetical protein